MNNYSFHTQGATFVGVINGNGTVMEELENTYLNKHVAAIHCSNNIGLLQRKIFNALLYKAYNRLLDDSFHYISLSELAKLIDFNSNNSSKLKQAFKNLQSTTVEWNIIENNNEADAEIWCSSTLLASSVIDRKRGFCRYEYSKTLSELLFQPDIYARIDLRIQNRFNSSYGLALYENCVRFKNVRTTGWINIDTFRKLMGVQDSMYPKFSDFNRRVLSPAIDEINKISDINVELQTNRVAQQVVSLKFNISNKKIAKPMGIVLKTDSIPPTKENEKSELHGILKNKFLASEQDITNLIKNYPADFINEKIQLIFESSSYKSGKIMVPLALLKSALKNNYAAPENKITGSESKKTKNFSWEQKKRYEEYKMDHILNKFDSLSEIEKTKIEKSFVTYLTKHTDLSYKIVIDMYHARGIKGASREFVEFAVSANVSIVDELMTLGDFCK